MGFLNPNKGFIEINNVKVNLFNNLYWQNKISFVPQKVFFSKYIDIKVFNPDEKIKNFEKIYLYLHKELNLDFYHKI